MYVCMMNQINGYPFIECLQGGSTPSSPLTSLSTFSCENKSDLNLNFGDYVLKIVNKSVYGFRLGVSGKKEMFYISDLTDTGSTC